MTAKIKLNAASGGGSVSLQAPASTTGNANVELKLPVADGSGFLKSDGSGNLSTSLTTSGTDNFTIADGNLVIGTAGHGIDFSAQTASSVSGTSVSSEVLDHYEEGSWTPDLRIGGSTTGITYDSSDPQSGRYVKIGRQVTVNYSLSLTSKGSQTGSVSIFGLPFAVASDMTGVTTHASGIVGFFNNITNSAIVMNLASSNNSGAALALRHTVGAEDDPDVMSETDLTDTSEFRGSITYFTDA